jgi:molybdate transport system substrate-binding protein
MKSFATIMLCICTCFAIQLYSQVAIAAASDLTFALAEIIASYRNANPGASISVTYGSSGKLSTQIAQGAPFDLYMSADISYPKQLIALGKALEPITPYGLGKIVLWSTTLDATHLSLSDLRSDKFKHIAIADPAHAPYGLRSQEALQRAGLWDAVQPRLVFGENIAQAAQFVSSGNADAGIVALSIVLSPELVKKGGYSMIPDSLYAPLMQGFVITAYGKGKNISQVINFVRFLTTRNSRDIMEKYGFSVPRQAIDSSGQKQ